MKTSFCTNVFKSEDMFSAIAELAGLGYDGVEFWNQYLAKTDIKHLHEVLEGNNIRASQICPYFDFVSGKEKWEESIRIAEKYIEIAKILKTDLIRVFTGKAGSREATQTQWKAAISGLKEIGKMGKPFGINYALETHPNSLMDKSGATIRLLEDVGMENLGVNLQVPLLDEEIMESVEKLGKYVIHLHVHNWKGKRPNFCWGELTFLDSGDYDFEVFLTVLKRHGFDGYISIEHSAHQGQHTPMETARHEIGYLKSLISKLDKE